MNDQLTKPKELIVYEFLTGRLSFSKGQYRKKQNLVNGFQGELFFSKLLKNAQGNFIPLYDLVFEYQGSIIQIDCLLILRKEIILLEIKHYYGEFLLQDDYLNACNTGKQYRNPLHQLQRSTLQLKEILFSLNISMPLTSHVVFTNSSFTLFQAKQNPMIVLPTQLNTFIDKLSRQPYVIEEPQYNVANLLWKSQYKKVNKDRLPYYEDFSSLTGILCKRCRLPVEKEYSSVYCGSCGMKERNAQAIMRNVNEFHVLFPEEKITVKNIYNWCDELISKATIRRVLTKNMQQVRKNKHTYYL